MDFNEPKAFDASAMPQHPLLFDVCHVGVVLRVVLGVQVVCGLAIAFHTASLRMAFESWMQTLMPTLFASLLWLVGACALRKPLACASEPLRWGFAALLGSFVAVLAHGAHVWMAGWLGDMTQHASWAMIVSAVIGGVMGAVCMAWLKQRARTQLPAQAAARLAELQARIRPHFLFNTLNTAIALVQIDPPRAEQVLEDLAELFRQALAAPQGRVTLAEEVALSRRYLDIEQLRFGDRLQVKWCLDESVNHSLWPPLILQPLVENAVRHGIETSPNGGWVEIITQAQGSHATLIVRNTVPQQTTLPFSPGHGMALDNVRQRLKLMHDVRMDFSSGLKSGEQPDASPVYEVRARVPLA